jgi:hypothetical protein
VIGPSPAKEKFHCFSQICIQSFQGLRFNMFAANYFRGLFLSCNQINKLNYKHGRKQNAPKKFVAIFLFTYKTLKIPAAHAISTRTTHSNSRMLKQISQLFIEYTLKERKLQNEAESRSFINYFYLCQKS